MGSSAAGPCFQSTALGGDVHFSVKSFKKEGFKQFFPQKLI